MSNFFTMGGYAFYVWASYGFVAAVLVCNYVAPKLRERKLLRELTRESSAAE